MPSVFFLCFALTGQEFKRHLISTDILPLQGISKIPNLKS